MLISNPLMLPSQDLPSPFAVPSLARMFQPNWYKCVQSIWLVLIVETGPQDMTSAISLNYHCFSSKCLGTSCLGLTLVVYAKNKPCCSRTNPGTRVLAGQHLTWRHRLVKLLASISPFFSLLSFLHHHYHESPTPGITVPELSLTAHPLRWIDIGPLCSCEKHVPQGVGATQSLENPGIPQGRGLHAGMDDAMEVDDTG